MRAGKLRRRASLQRRQVIQDGFGAEVVSWAEFAAVAASVESLQGREYFAAQQGLGAQGEATTRIRVRFIGGVQVADRVVVGRGPTAGVYDIEAVIADERGRELELMCRRMVE